MSVKKKILDSIKYVKEELGYTLVSEDWGSAKHKCACALGCVLIQKNKENELSTSESAKAAAELLEVDEAWVDAFINGFDINGTATESPFPEAWEMGYQVAKETRPIPYHLWDGNPT